MQVILDVSTSVAWRRPPVGIVRVEQEFARSLLDRPEIDSRFCRFDRASGAHVEVSRDDVAALLVPAAGGPPSAAGAPAALDAVGAGEPGRLRLRNQLAVAARRVVDRFPSSVRGEALHAARTADDLLRSLYWLGLKLRPRGPTRGPALGAAPRGQRIDSSFVPGPDAVYVSMGLDWDFNDLSAVWQLKRAYGLPVVLFCHDVIPLLFPHLTPSDSRDTFARYFVDLAHVADRIVAVSETSRKDLVAFLRDVGAPVPDAHVIHSGSDVRERARMETFPPRDDLRARRFVLCVGTLEARKNHELLYQLWERLATIRGDDTPLLVLVGMVGWGTADVLNQMRLNRTVRDKIVVLSDLPDGALFWLYEHCLFTVFPSHYEGWGLPVVESLALGTPCVISNAPALLEASQGLVPALDPLDFTAWLEQLGSWLFDPGALEAARDLVRSRYRVTSWAEHADALLEVLRRAAARAVRRSGAPTQPDAPARVSSA